MDGYKGSPAGSHAASRKRGRRDGREAGGPQEEGPGACAPGPSSSAPAGYFCSIFRRSISFFSTSRFVTLNSTRRFFAMLSGVVFRTSGRVSP